jgi:hypothetical protein
MITIMFAVGFYYYYFYGQFISIECLTLSFLFEDFKFDLLFFFILSANALSAKCM